MWSNEVLQKAIFMASKAHDGQYMKTPTDVPYLAHPICVLMLATKYAMCEKEVDFDLLCAVAVLHDTLEDTALTYGEIEQEFGSRVAQGVLALSKNEELPKREQMPDCIRRIKLQPKEVAMVKLADRLFNLRGRVSSWSREKQEAYKEEGKMILKELGSASPVLTTALEEQIKTYERS